MGGAKFADPDPARVDGEGDVGMFGDYFPTNDATISPRMMRLFLHE